MVRKEKDWSFVVRVVLAGHGMSEHQLAEHLDMSRESISKWRRGQRIPSTEVAFKLLAMLREVVDTAEGQLKI